jgi:hypothetical protein
MRMFLAALLFLVGCADETPIYQRQEGKTEEDLERDKADCEMRMLSSNVEMINRSAFERACMRSKGWVQTNSKGWLQIN